VVPAPIRLPDLVGQRRDARSAQGVPQNRSPHHQPRREPLGAIFDDTAVVAAILDRLLRRSVVINITAAATACAHTQKRRPRTR
jgi:hypothetical protein